MQPAELGEQTVVKLLHLEATANKSVLVRKKIWLSIQQPVVAILSNTVFCKVSTNNHEEKS